MATPQELIETVAANRILAEPEQVEAFDGALAELAGAPLKDADIDALFLVFDDACENREVMCGLMHLLERIESPGYERALAKALPRMAGRASDWAEILQSRLLNEEATAKSLGWALGKATPESRQAAAVALRKIAAEDEAPRSDRARRVLKAIGAD